MNEESEVLFELPFRHFEDYASVQEATVIPRAGSVMDVCYIYHDKETEISHLTNDMNQRLKVGNFYTLTAQFLSKTTVRACQLLLTRPLVVFYD